MAAIDSLLRLIGMQKAEGLVLNTGKAPALIHGGMPRLLSMPPLSQPMIDGFIKEVLTGPQLEALEASGVVEGSYHSEKDGPFSVKVRVSHGKLVVTFRPSAARAAGHTAASSVEPGPEEVAPEGAEEVPERRPLEPSRPVTEAPARLAGLLEHALVEGASDLVLSIGEAPAMRVAAGWKTLPGNEVREEELLALLEPGLTDGRRRALVESGSVDLTHRHLLEGGHEQRFRVNLFRQSGGLAAAFRPIRDEVPTLAQLNLPESLRALVEMPHGLVLVTGPTGSGKSTTLAALIDHLNRTRPLHILTLEDPIEFLYRRKRSIIHQREVGIHVESFAAGLRAALREAPDVILVGEMRDRETIAAALTAAETGHLVLSTLHTGSASMAIDRVIDVFPEHQQAQVRTQLAMALKSVVTQRLLPGAQAGTRVPAIEILHINYAVASLIRDRKVYQIPTQMQLSREEGMLSFEQSLAELVRTGRITRETASRATADLSQLREWLREKG